MQNNEYLNNQDPNLEENPVQETASDTEPAQATDAPQEPVQDPAPQDDPQPVEKKTAKKNILAIVAAIVVSVALLSALVFGAAALIRAQNPLNLVSDAFANTMGELLKEPETTLNGGSVEVSVDLATFLESFVGYASVDGDASLKFYADDTPASAVVASLKMGGSAVLDLTAVFNDERMAVASDVLFGDDAYGFSFDSFSEKFDDSVFGLDGEYSLGLSAEDIIGIFADVPVSEDFAEDAAAIFADFLLTFKKSLDEHVTVEKTDKTLTFAGKDCKTTAVSVSIDTLGLYNILHDMTVYVNESEDIRAFIEKHYSESMAVFLADFTYEEVDPEEFAEEFYAQIGEFLSEMETAKANGTVEETEIDIALTFYVSKNSKYLVGAVLDGEIDGESLKIEAYAGPKPREMTEISLRVDDGYTTIEATFKVEENTKDAYAAAFTLLADSESLIDSDYRWNKNDGAFALTLDFYGAVATLNGEFIRDKDGSILVLDTFAVEDDAYELGVTVTTTYSDKMPEITEYTDLLNMDAEEVEGILYGFLTDLMVLFG